MGLGQVGERRKRLAVSLTPSPDLQFGEGAMRARHVAETLSGDTERARTLQRYKQTTKRNRDSYSCLQGRSTRPASYVSIKIKERSALSRLADKLGALGSVRDCVQSTCEPRCISLF